MKTISAVCKILVASKFSHQCYQIFVLSSTNHTVTWANIYLYICTWFSCLNNITKAIFWKCAYINELLHKTNMYMATLSEAHDIACFMLFLIRSCVIIRRVKREEVKLGETNV